MSLTVEEWQRMQRKAIEDERAKNLAEGEKAAILKRLQEEYGCKNAKAAAKLLAEKTERKEKLNEALAEKKEAFTEKYGDDF